MSSEEEANAKTQEMTMDWVRFSSTNLTITNESDTTIYVSHYIKRWKKIEFMRVMINEIKPAQTVAIQKPSITQAKIKSIRLVFTSNLSTLTEDILPDYLKRYSFIKPKLNKRIYIYNENGFLKCSKKSVLLRKEGEMLRSLDESYRARNAFDNQPVEEGKITYT